MVLGLCVSLLQMLTIFCVLLWLQYIVELLRKNESLEFFIEGSRSRTGLANIPKGGLLSILVDAWKGGNYFGVLELLLFFYIKAIAFNRLVKYFV